MSQAKHQAKQMMRTVLVIDDDPTTHEIVAAALAETNYRVLSAANGETALTILEQETIELALVDYQLPEMNGLELLERVRQVLPQLPCIMITAFGTPEAVLGAMRERVDDFLLKPFTLNELRGSVTAALEEHHPLKIEILSASPDWVHLRVPCDLSAVPWLQKLLTQLKADLPENVREAMAYAFREMLNNAIEHGGKLDPTKFVEVSCIRLKRAVIYHIKDPGEGFKIETLEHAAVNNPSEDPFRHVLVRDEKGLRAGGFGILLTNQLVDELVYNEQRNELMFVKYL